MAPSAVDATPTSVTPAKSVVNHVQFRTAEVTTCHEAVEALKRDGGVIVRNFISGDKLAQIGSDLIPLLDLEETYDGHFFTSETRRLQGLAGKSAVYCEEVLMHPLWKEVTDAMLTKTTAAWNGAKLIESTSKPQLSATGLVAIGPGAKDQPLHRDDMVHHVEHPRITADEYKIGRDTSIGLFLAGSPYTKANGATRFAPGSHLQASREPPNEEDCVYVELNPGDAFMMLNSCYHGGSSNTTIDQVRILYATIFTKGYLRQEENQYVAVPRAKLLEYPEHIQRKIGYEMSAPYVGWVEVGDPLPYVTGKKQILGDLF